MHELLAALGLLLVIEGIWPFLNPRHLRKSMLKIAGTEDQVLRWAGLSSMLIGLLLLYLIR